MNKKFTIKDIDRIYLTLGMNCNFNCKYCYQSEDKNKNLYTDTKEVSSNIIKYIKNVSKEAEKTLTLMFWGGEPLMYFNLIKDIVEKLKDIKINYSIVTNGSLLTKEKVDFLNTNNISVGISHDGKNTYITRKKDILNDKGKLELIKKINDLSIVTVFSSYNFDLLKTAEYCEEKLGREVHVNLEWLHCDNNTDKALYTFNKELVKEKLLLLLEKIEQDLINGEHSGRIKTLYQFLYQTQNNNNNKIPYCMQMRKSLNIDLAGNVTACHPYGKLGTILDNHEDLIKKYDEKYNIAFDFEDCSKCKWINECKAGCPLEYPCEGKKAMCEIKAMFYETIKDFLSKSIMVNN